MNTPNLDKVRSVRNPSPLQYAILLYGDEQTASLEDLLDAERAASELAAMQARIDTLEAHMQEAIDNCETCHGSVDCARCKTFEADLKGE